MAEMSGKMKVVMKDLTTAASLAEKMVVWSVEERDYERVGSTVAMKETRWELRMGVSMVALMVEMSVSL